MEHAGMKAALATVFPPASPTALSSTLSLLGRSTHRVTERSLLGLHRATRHAFSACAPALAVFGARIPSSAGDGPTVRSVLRCAAAVTLAVSVAAVSPGFARAAGR